MEVYNSNTNEEVGKNGTMNIWIDTDRALKYEKSLAGLLTKFQHF